MNIRSIDVVVDNLESNPYCFHGPTILFKKLSGKTKEYYACSACRDSKDCNFYLPANEKNNKSNLFWKEEITKVVNETKAKNLHKKYLKILNSLKNNEKNKTINKNIGNYGYCYSCNCLFNSNEDTKHLKCKTLLNLNYHQITHPTEIVIPKTENKTHAQYFFSQESTNDIIMMLKRMKINKALCIGVPRIHEFILNNCSDLKSLLLDLDKNYFNFYSNEQFVWYNMFNNYVFDPEQEDILKKFLNSGEVIILLDPPFGGRVEPLTRTLKKLSEISSTKGESLLKTFWFFPYFMEQYILESLPQFKMFDYKVNYENHNSFTNSGNRKRKHGSPVRIFTNINLCEIDLKGVSGYKFCNDCGHWVSNENKHCSECNGCTSKDGRTYVHCSKCSKCVKPSYAHCATCSRCCLPNHTCGEFQPDTNCYHCHKPGHKKSNCPEIEKIKNQNINENPKKKRRKFR